MKSILEFNLSKNIIRQTLEDANKFIKIVVFQLTSNKIADLLIKKANEGLDVDIITLPEDSFARVEERESIHDLYNSMKEKGINLHLCDWEVGDPSLTATSLSGEMAEGGGSKWYSLHGKFIVTDKCALISSANLTDEEQWEVHLRLDKKFVNHFEEKFEELYSLFIAKSSYEKLNGKIYDKVTEDVKNEIENLWKRSNRKNISQYPPALIPKSKLKTGLHISPFDGRARIFLYDIITQAQDFIYISSERLYDDKIVDFLKKKALTTNVNIQIITGHPRNVRQNPSKAESFAMEMLATDIGFNVLDNVHAKFWLSEKWLMIGSPNLTKMNLGFRKAHDFWRSNTETLFFINEPALLNQAKKKFEMLLNKSDSGILAISETPRKLSQARKIFKTFNIQSRKSAKIILSRIETRLKIKSRSDLIRIAKFSVKLANVLQDRYVEGTHVVMALMLFFLQERKHSKKELEEKMLELVEHQKITTSIERLVRLGYCIVQDDTYMINLEKIVA